jgi:hypothetical protein
MPTTLFFLTATTLYPRCPHLSLSFALFCALLDPLVLLCSFHSVISLSLFCHIALCVLSYGSLCSVVWLSLFCHVALFILLCGSLFFSFLCTSYAYTHSLLYSPYLVFILLLVFVVGSIDIYDYFYHNCLPAHYASRAKPLVRSTIRSLIYLEQG